MERRNCILSIIKLKKIAVILSIILIATFFGCKETSAQQSQLLEPQEMIDVLVTKDVHLVDVRTPREFKMGFIENAINIDFSSPNFQAELNKLDNTKPIIVYCRSGRRSGIATNNLVKAGFTEIYDLRNGIINWQRQGQKLVK